MFVQKLASRAGETTTFPNEDNHNNRSPYYKIVSPQ